MHAALSETSSGNTRPSLCRRVWRYLLRPLLWVVGGVVVLCVLACVALNLYLTPRRLAAIASDYAGKYLDADIRMKSMSFTLWSSFPTFELNIDSAVIISRRMQRLSAAQRSQLPCDCDTLATFGNFSGSINPLRLLYGRISVNRLHIKGLRLNLVALNDSVDNYSILPYTKPDKPFVMPRFEAGHVCFTDLKPLTYYSAATQASALVNISKATMAAGGRNSYQLDLKGRFSLKVEKLTLLRQFPFNFSGTARVRFSPFRLFFNRFNVALGNVRSQVNMSMLLGDNKSQLTAMSYEVNSFNLMQLFMYLPKRWLPAPSAVRSNVSLEASVRLTKPYRFSSETLPSFVADLRVPDSWLCYPAPAGVVKVRDIGMNAALLFDGDNINNSSFNIYRLSMAAAGMQAVMRGRVTNLFGTPFVEVEADASADLKAVASLLPRMPASASLRGSLKAHLASAFSASPQVLQNPSRIPVTGVASLRNVAAAINKDASFSVSGKSASLAFATRNSMLHVEALANGISVTTPDLNSMSARRVRLKMDAPLADLQNSATLSAELYRMSASVADSMHLALADLRIQGTLNHGTLSASLSGSRLLFADSLRRGLLGKLSCSASADLKKIFGTGAKRRTVSGLLPRSLHLTAANGTFITPEYPTPVRLADLAVTLTPQQLAVQRLRLASQSNSFLLSGCLDNYLSLSNIADTTHTPTADATFFLQADTVDINQIAGTLMAGKQLMALLGGTTATPATPDTLPSPSPSGALLLPRFLNAQFKLKVKNITYTSLNVRDVTAAMRLQNGIFSLDTIHAGTDFGTAHANAVYKAADALNMGVKCAVWLDSINVVAFFRQFHTLLEMMPQMSNLSGMVSASAQGEFDIFPDMVMNLPSLTATVTTSGRELKVHQSKFIHRICRALLIHTADDLHIHNIDVRATIHDNQLELYPFIFEMNRYKLLFAGENDFAGNLYYHVGILHSPLPLHFGVNITGTFNKYHIRIGRARFRQYRAMRQMQLLQHHKINIITELKWFAAKFMQKAADADRTTARIPGTGSSSGTPSGADELLRCYKKYIGTIGRGGAYNPF